MDIAPNDMDDFLGGDEDLAPPTPVAKILANQDNPVNSDPQVISAAAGTSSNSSPAANLPPEKKPMRIGEHLISLGIISADQLQVALQEQKNSKKLLGQVLVELGFITEQTLAEVLAESTGTRRFDPKTAVLDQDLIRKVPKEVASRHKSIPVGMNDEEVQIAMADVYNVIAIDQIRRYFPRHLKLIPIFCTESEISEMIDQYYDYEMSIDGILKEIETGVKQDAKKLEQGGEGYVNPTVRLVNALLVDAIREGASDIHIEPEGMFVRVRYRIDGLMTQVKSFHRDYWSAIAVRMKIMSGMNIAETRNPQDGRITYNVMGREVDFRVSTIPTVHGENIVLRLLDKKKSLVPLENLGFSEHNITLLKKLIQRPEGIIIVTGPTGSGKTTTLYSVLNYINSLDVNIMTLEDPVEYQLPLIRQSQVREGGGLDFAHGIRALLRQDPDIIFIGEIRDEDTGIMAVRAALTGHQVYSTLHTNDALGAIPRLIDIGVPRSLLSGTLVCCLAQRLARKLCPDCRTPRQATPEEGKIMGFDATKLPTIYQAVGCPKCKGRGYKGRVGIVEILPIDREMDELIYNSASRKQMLNYALEQGFVSMQQDGIEKVLRGEIDLAELVSNIDMTFHM
jgi:general secretion pathway protein E/type IV pilus assembly protein PilB